MATTPIPAMSYRTNSTDGHAAGTSISTDNDRGKLWLR